MDQRVMGFLAQFSRFSREFLGDCSEGETLEDFLEGLKAGKRALLENSEVERHWKVFDVKHCCSLERRGKFDARR